MPSAEIKWEMPFSSSILNKLLRTYIYDYAIRKKYEVNFYRPPTKLREGSVFTRVCLFKGGVPMSPLTMMY